MSSSSPEPQAEQRIIVGVDGSQESIDALQWAARQAQLSGATLEAVIAWQYPMSSSGYLLGVREDWKAQSRAVIDHAVDLAELPAELQISRRVIEGHPAQVLSEAASDADLLVVGNRGHGGFPGMLLGSVSAHVCSHAPCPVVVIRHINARD